MLRDKENILSQRPLAQPSPGCPSWGLTFPSPTASPAFPTTSSRTTTATAASFCPESPCSFLPCRPALLCSNDARRLNGYGRLLPRPAPNPTTSRNSTLTFLGGASPPHLWPGGSGGSGLPLSPQLWGWVIMHPTAGQRVHFNMLVTETGSWRDLGPKGAKEAKLPGPLLEPLGMRIHHSAKISRGHEFELPAAT